jgi:hypothetical protein
MVVSSVAGASVAAGAFVVSLVLESSPPQAASAKPATMASDAILRMDEYFEGIIVFLLVVFTDCQDSCFDRCLLWSSEVTAKNRLSAFVMNSE